MGQYPVLCVEQLSGLGCVDYAKCVSKGTLRAKVTYRLDGHRQHWQEMIFGPTRFIGSIRFASRSDHYEFLRVGRCVLESPHGRKLPLEMIEIDPEDPAWLRVGTRTSPVGLGAES
jgi:hypothetical protein